MSLKFRVFSKFLTVKNYLNKLDTYNSSVNSHIKYQNLAPLPLKHAVPESRVDGRAKILKCHIFG